MTTKEKRVLIVMRVIANILVAAIIAGAIALITWRTIATTKAPAATTNVTVPKTKPSWFQQNELSLDITAITSPQYPLTSTAPGVRGLSSTHRTLIVCVCVWVCEPTYRYRKDLELPSLPF